MALTKVSSAGLNINAGLPFPATAVAVADANTLDDYEEGTWTVGFTGSSSTHTGYYTKIGNQVTAWGYLGDINSSSAGSTVYVTGLPFTVGAMTDLIAGSLAYVVYVNYPSVGQLGIYPIVSGTTAGLRFTADDAAGTIAVGTDFDHTNSGIGFTLFYTA